VSINRNARFLRYEPICTFRQSPPGRRCYYILLYLFTLRDSFVIIIGFVRSFTISASVPNTRVSRDYAAAFRYTLCTISNDRAKDFSPPREKKLRFYFESAVHDCLKADDLLRITSYTLRFGFLSARLCTSFLLRSTGFIVIIA